jgi:hypothetical protein
MTTIRERERELLKLSATWTRPSFWLRYIGADEIASAARDAEILRSHEYERDRSAPVGQTQLNVHWSMRRSRPVAPIDIHGTADPLSAASRGLSELLVAARAASPTDRIGFRDQVAAYGADAIAAMGDWLRDERLCAFAVRVVAKAAGLAPAEARSALTLALAKSPSSCQRDAGEALQQILGSRSSPWPPLRAEERTVLFVDDGPFSSTDLRTSLQSPELDMTERRHGFVDTVVLGTDAVVDGSVLALIQQSPRPARFLPQEGWIELLLFGRDWWLDATDRLNEALESHRPLSLIRAAWPSGFQWPGVESGGTGTGDVDFEPISALRRLGYQISGQTDRQRWNVLVERAVPTLGLRAVAEHIALLVKLRKLQGHGQVRYARAISAWEGDLAKLKGEFYRPGASGFPWPTTDD